METFYNRNEASGCVYLFSKSLGVVLRMTAGGIRSVNRHLGRGNRHFVHSWDGGESILEGWVRSCLFLIYANLENEL